MQQVNLNLQQHQPPLQRLIVNFDNNYINKAPRARTASSIELVAVLICSTTLCEGLLNTWSATSGPAGVEGQYALKSPL
jgi:hypothetical protein